MARFNRISIPVIPTQRKVSVIRNVLERIGFSLAVLVISAQSVLALDAQIQGDLSEELHDELKAASLVMESLADDVTHTENVYSSAVADYKRLLAVLYQSGYYGAIISITLDGHEAADIEPIAAPKSVNVARISIQTGAAFRFGVVTVAPLAQETEIPEGFKTGEIAHLSTLRGASRAAIAGWRDQGHAKAKISSQHITAKHREALLNAALQIEPGPKLNFGKLIITGNRRVRTERILAIAGLPEGKVFSPEELDDAAKRLRRTGAFNSVALTEAENIGPGQTLDITAEVSEQRRRRIGFGGDLSTSEGASFSAYWMHRNLLGGAENLRIEGEISGIGGDRGGENYRLSARFERPATFGVDNDFFAFATLEQLDEVNYFSRQATIGAGVKYIASDHREYEYGIGLTAAETRDALGEDEYLLFVLPTRLTRDYRDFELDATKGYYLQASATPFYAINGADNGLRTFIDYRIYRSFNIQRPVTLALRAQFGSVAGPSLSDAPADFLFYSGGGGTVRGHPYQSLGVDVGGGNQVGGRSFIGLSAEARVKATDTIGIVGFFDYGFIGSDPFPGDTTGEFQSGAGIGVRYHTGIGPIRLDVAVPVSGPNKSSDFEIYIGIGQAF